MNVPRQAPLDSDNQRVLVADFKEGIRPIAATGDMNMDSPRSAVKDGLL